MALDTEQARDGMYLTFQQTWDDPILGWQSISGLTEEPYVRFANVNGTKEADPDTASPWIWISVQHDDSVNEAFGDGRPVYEATGNVFLQIFVPLGTGLTLADAMVKVAKRAFQGKRGPDEFCDIVFRGARVREIGSDGRWHQTNIIVGFEYDEE